MDERHSTCCAPGTRLTLYGPISSILIVAQYNNSTREVGIPIIHGEGMWSLERLSVWQCGVEPGTAEQGGSCRMHRVCDHLQELLGCPVRPSIFTQCCTTPRSSMLWVSYSSLPGADFRTSGYSMSFMSAPMQQTSKHEMQRPWNSPAPHMDSNTASLDYSFRIQQLLNKLLFF